MGSSACRVAGHATRRESCGALLLAAAAVGLGLDPLPADALELDQAFVSSTRELADTIESYLTLVRPCTCRRPFCAFSLPAVAPRPLRFAAVRCRAFPVFDASRQTVFIHRPATLWRVAQVKQRK